MSFLDEAVNFEQAFIDKGYKEGYENGTLEGRQDGMVQGFENGFSFGLVLGEIVGHCQFLLDDTSNVKLLKESNKRAYTTLVNLSEACRQLTLKNTDKSSEAFEKILLKYKQLQLQLKSEKTTTQENGLLSF